MDEHECTIGAQAPRWAWRAVCATAGALLLTVAACGDGKDRTFDLPAGANFDSVRGSSMLVAVEASNDCRSQGTCTADTAPPADSAACDVGSGNTRGLALYRLGANGLIFHDPGTSESPGAPEQVIGTADNPRRLIAHPNDASLLYLATLERIQVFRLDSDGSARCIDQTLSEKEVDPRTDQPLDPIDLVIDPTVDDGILYVASSGANRIDAYAIAADGTLPEIPTSCVVGTVFARFAAVTLASDDFLIAGGRGSLDVYRREAGQFPPPTPNPSATPTPVPSPAAPTCIGAILVTEPVSSIGAGFVTDLLFWPSVEGPLGEIVAAEELTRQLITFPVDSAGMFSADATSATSRVGIYQSLLRHEHGGQVILYASVFNEGHVDAFLVENDRLPRRFLSRTAADPKALPVGLAIADSGDLLYVAQGGLGRIDGFRILADGALETVPTTSTRPIPTAGGTALETFPNDVAVVQLP